MTPPPPPATTVGVGLISVGWMGRLHTKAYTSVPYAYPELGIRPRLVRAADTSRERVDHAVDVLGYAAGSTDYHEVLEDPAVDAVSICAPNALHREMGVAAARAGKPFWVEKPVGRHLADTSAVAAAVRQTGVLTCIGFNYRHAPAIEHARALVAQGRLGRVTNVRSVFFNCYANEPNGALSWRFTRELAGSGVLGDLFSHVVDLVQYVAGPLASVSALTDTVYRERPVLPMGAGTHFAVVEGGETGPVENEDYAAAVVRLGPDAAGGPAVGTLEASRVIVGPQSQLALEVYGTEGSLRWDFERLNELQVCLGRGGVHHGYTTVLANAGFGDYGKFQPGPGIGMGYDDLKTVEAKKFLVAVTGGERLGSTIDDAVSAAEVVAAMERSAAAGTWQDVAQVAGSSAARRA